MQMTLYTIQNFTLWRGSKKSHEGRNEVLCKCSAMAICAKKFLFQCFLGHKSLFCKYWLTCMKWLNNSCVVCCIWLSNRWTFTLLILLFIQHNVQRCLNFHSSLFSTTLLHVSQKGVPTTHKSNIHYISSDSVPRLYQFLSGCAKGWSPIMSQTAGIQECFHNIIYLVNISDFQNFPYQYV
jgi:hypothetical protein